MNSPAESAGASESVSPQFTPTRIMQVDIAQPLPRIDVLDGRGGGRYERVMVLIRLHTQPVGVIDIQLREQGVSPEEFAHRIWDHLGGEINAHLQRDGLPSVSGLGPGGIPGPDVPECIKDREELLRHAPFVSVVVATRDRASMLASTLETLLELDYPNYEILVVDNAPSTNETADLIARSYGDSGKVRYVREDRPGLSVAHNRALEEVSAPIVAFTDDDVLVDRYWLAELVRGFDAGPNVGCVTGLVLPAEIETPAQQAIEHYVGFGKGFTTRIFDLKDNRDRDPLFPYLPGQFGTGANMAFQASSLEEIGGFAPDLGTGTVALGGDDLDSFFRIIAGGYQLVYQPAAVLWHYHRRESAALRRQAYGYGVGLMAFFTKTVFDNPLRLFDIVARLPSGVRRILQLRSGSTAQRSGDYPRELVHLERKGMLYGPIAYLRSFWNHRRLAREERYGGPDRSAKSVERERISTQ